MEHSDQFRTIGFAGGCLGCLGCLLAAAGVAALTYLGMAYAVATMLAGSSGTWSGSR